MSTFTVTKPDGEVLTDLTETQVGNVLAREWGGEWRLNRHHDGSWQMECRSTDWYPTPVIVSGETEEQANAAALEIVARDPAWQFGFSIKTQE